MAKTPKMQSWINQDSKNRCLTVVVEHGAVQSYTRAVFPKVKRDVVSYLKETGQYLVTYIESVDYGPYAKGTEELPAKQRRPLTIFTISY